MAIINQLANQGFTKWDKHQIETLHAEFCKSILQHPMENTQQCMQSRIRTIPTNNTNSKEGIQMS